MALTLRHRQGIDCAEIASRWRTNKCHTVTTQVPGTFAAFTVQSGV